MAGESKSIARVIVGFRSSYRGEALLDVSAVMARALRADLKGVYVREDVLRDLAGLPFAAAMEWGRGSALPMTPEAIERAWLREAAVCRRAVSHRAGLESMAWSFETASGSLEDVLLGSAGVTDLVALAEDVLDPAPGALAERLRAITSHARAIMLVGSRRDGLRPGPVVAIDQGGEKGAAAVRLAAQLATALARDLRILAVGPGHETAAGAPVTRLDTLDPVELVATLRAMEPGLIVADLHRLPVEEKTGARSLVRATGVPVVFAGGAGAGDSE